MPISAQHIRDTLARYLDAYPKDAAQLAPFTAMLGSAGDVTSRKEFDGHATAGAVLVDADGQVLMVHHRTLDRWLCPGGHLESQDTDFTAAALRELAEETGIDPAAVEPIGTVPLHIDVHTIPANKAKGEPEHQHVDFRILLRTTRGVTLTPQVEEVLSVAWQPVARVPGEVLRDRVAQAVEALSASA